MVGLEAVSVQLHRVLLTTSSQYRKAARNHRLTIRRRPSAKHRGCDEAGYPSPVHVKGQSVPLPPEHCSHRKRRGRLKPSATFLVPCLQPSTQRLAWKATWKAKAFRYISCTLPAASH